MEKMNEDNVVDQIFEMVSGIEEIIELQTFEDAGLSTQSKGLVIKYDDGTKFHMTVTKEE